MADISGIIGKYPARTPRAIIGLLVAHRKSLAENAYKNVPYITVYTSDHHAFTGWVLDLSDNDETLLLNAPDDLRAGTSEVLYVSLRMVTAVKVYNPEKLPVILSDGRVTRAPGEAVPSRLELKRAVAAQSDQLKASARLTLEVDWESLPDAGDSFLNVRDFVSALLGAVESIAKSGDGREALAAFKSIRVRHDGGGLAATKDGKALVIAFNAAKGLPANPAQGLDDLLNRSL